MLLAKGGDFMTLVKKPFKKKRSTIAGDGKRSPSTTPRSARGSTARSSVGSSVNSYEESEVCGESNNNTSNNIYADIDVDDDDKCCVATNIPADCAPNPPDLPAANQRQVLQVSTISECEQFEECVEDDLLPMADGNTLNCSKNNLLLIDDFTMTNSIDNHLNDIELINKNLDKLMEAHQEIDNDDQDEAVPPEIKAEKKKLKKLIAQKIKLLKEARMMSPTSSDAAARESFKSRVKNIFPKKQEEVVSEDKTKTRKGFLSSFKKKSTEKELVDETEESFEEIKKLPPDAELQVTDLDENAKSKFSSKFKSKFKSISSRINWKFHSADDRTCRRCLKPLESDFSVPDQELCVCVDVELDDGICIKNFEYKDVSRFTGFFFA